jgi:hypothetical protein
MFVLRSLSLRLDEIRFGHWTHLEPGLVKLVTRHRLIAGASGMNPDAIFFHRL